jgi:hypothetical protein
MWSEDFERNIEDFPREYTQKCWIKWRAFIIISAGLEISGQREQKTADLHASMRAAYERKLDSIFTTSLLAGEDKIRPLMHAKFCKQVSSELIYSDSDDEMHRTSW